MAELVECPLCLDTGWQDCSADWCSEPENHGGYCTCEAGQQRRLDDEQVGWL